MKSLVMRLVVAVGLLPACLVAPDRPGSGGDGGVDADAGTECQFGPDADLPVIAALPHPGGTQLVRAGFDRGAHRVHFYDPAPQFSATCYSHSVELVARDGNPVERIEAVGLRQSNLLVLVTRLDGTPAVYEVDRGAYALTALSVTSRVPLEPIDPPDATAMIQPWIAHSSFSNQIWFGGGQVQIAELNGTMPSTATGYELLAANVVTDKVVLGVTLRASTASDEFALVGRLADRRVHLREGVLRSTSSVGPRDASCETFSRCPLRHARPLFPGTPGAYVALSWAPATSELSPISADPVVITPPIPVDVGTIDATIYELVEPSDSEEPSAPELVTLFASSGESRIIVRPGLSSTETLLGPAFPAVDRIAVGTFDPDAPGPQILTLVNQVGRGTSAEGCFVMSQLAGTSDPIVPCAR